MTLTILTLVALTILAGATATDPHPFPAAPWRCWHGCIAAPTQPDSVQGGHNRTFQLPACAGMVRSTLAS